MSFCLMMTLVSILRFDWLLNFLLLKDPEKSDAVNKDEIPVASPEFFKKVDRSNYDGYINKVKQHTKRMKRSSQATPAKKSPPKSKQTQDLETISKLTARTESDSDDSQKDYYFEDSE